jgi:hypothetical protein
MKMPDAKAGAGRTGKSTVLLATAVFLSIGGLAAFVYLFALDFNLYWLILSPVILALYELPATFFYWLFKKAQRQAAGPHDGPDRAGGSADGSSGGTPPAR